MEGFADDEASLISFPSDGMWYEIFIYLVLFPLTLLMHKSVPDVRHIEAHGGNPTASLPLALFSTLSCLVWLIVGSYTMVTSLEALAELLDIPDAVVGVTLSAAGTSLPNYVASQVAARQGFGNQAVSNAFGSNTFNIMVGLGLPWLLYTADGHVYNSLRAEGILEMVIILGSVLVIFIVFILLSQLCLHRWHAWVFIGLYVSYIFYTVAKVYITGATNN
jgi:Ca2+/Na+ antiporter